MGTISPDKISLNRTVVEEAKPGDDVAIKMVGKCRNHDKVYMVTE